MIRCLATSRTSARRDRVAIRPQAEGLEDRRLLSAGALDPTFDGDGYAVLSSTQQTKTSTPLDIATAVDVQADGKVLVAGRGNGVFQVVRLLSDGQLDPGFGSGGRALPLSGGSAYDMAVQSDGRIVLAGFVNVPIRATSTSADTNYEVALVRLLSNGSLDMSFGQGGKVLTGISTSTSTSRSYNLEDIAYAVAVQVDGKIVVGGVTYNGTASGEDSVLLRYNANGSLDTTFGQGGKVVTAWSVGNEAVSDLAIQPDGKIVTAGYFYANGSNAPYVTRYNADGSVDTGFGSAGLVTSPGTAATTVISTQGLALQADGGIVATMKTFNGSNWDLTVARYTAAGSPDTSFGGGTGLASVSLPDNEGGWAVTVQPDGKLVAGGFIAMSTENRALLVRFQADGSLDMGFGNGGVASPGFADGGTDMIHALDLQLDGKIVAAGRTTPAGKTYNAFLVARFNGDTASLLASAAAPSPICQTLVASQARPVLADALSYWRARGADTSRLGGVNLVIADLGGVRLGEASGTTITLDDNAAGWGWSTGQASARGRGRLAGRMDLLKALIHEVGHLLGHDHEEGGVMAETLAPATSPARGPLHLAANAFRVRGRGYRVASRG